MCPVPAASHAHFPQCHPGLWCQYQRGLYKFRFRVCPVVLLTHVLILSFLFVHLLSSSSSFSKWEWSCALWRSTSAPIWMTSSPSSEWVTVPMFPNLKTPIQPPVFFFEPDKQPQTLHCHCCAHFSHLKKCIQCPWIGTVEVLCYPTVHTMSSSITVLLMFR